MAWIFDAAWREKATLSDGRKIELRLLRGDDAPLLAAAFEKLSNESRVRRFHGARLQLSADELRYLTQIDGENTSRSARSTPLTARRWASRASSACRKSPVSPSRR